MNRRELLAGAAALVGLKVFPGCNSGRQNIRHAESERRDTASIPTIELHRHFEAGMSPETIAFLAQRNGVSVARTKDTKQLIENLDPQNPESTRAYFRRIAAGFKEEGGLARFFDSLGVGTGVMKTLEDLEYAACQQIVDQSRAGNIHTELRGSPYSYEEQLNQRTSFEEVIRAIRRGIERAYAEHGASGAFIACFSRGKKADLHGKAVVDAVLATHTSDHPVGLDMAGTEPGFPPANFETLFQPAREAGVPITVHAGEQSKTPGFEATPPSFVVDAVTKLGARRIGHGTALMADANALALIKERGIHVETCPVSNDAMDFMHFDRHPLRYFLDEGLSVTVNTDDPLPFGISSVREMLERYGNILRITPEDILKMTRYGIAAAFVTPERRATLEKQLEARIRT